MSAIHAACVAEMRQVITIQLLIKRRRSVAAAATVLSV
jgi:hypothetical protein